MEIIYRGKGFFCVTHFKITTIYENQFLFIIMHKAIYVIINNM